MIKIIEHTLKKIQELNFILTDKLWPLNLGGGRVECAKWLMFLIIKALSHKTVEITKTWCDIFTVV